MLENYLALLGLRHRQWQSQNPHSEGSQVSPVLRFDFTMLQCMSPTLSEGWEAWEWRETKKTKLYFNLKAPQSSPRWEHLDRMGVWGMGFVSQTDGTAICALPLTSYVTLDKE